MMKLPLIFGAAAVLIGTGTFVATADMHQIEAKVYADILMNLHKDRTQCLKRISRLDFSQNLSCPSLQPIATWKSRFYDDDPELKIVCGYLKGSMDGEELKFVYDANMDETIKKNHPDLQLMTDPRGTVQFDGNTNALIESNKLLFNDIWEKMCSPTEPYAVKILR